RVPARSSLTQPDCGAAEQKPGAWTGLQAAFQQASPDHWEPHCAHCELVWTATEPGKQRSRPTSSRRSRARTHLAFESRSLLAISRDFPFKSLGENNGKLPGGTLACG